MGYFKWGFFFSTYHFNTSNAIFVFITVTALLTINVFFNNSLQGCLLPINLVGVNKKVRATRRLCVEIYRFFSWHVPWYLVCCSYKNIVNSFMTEAVIIYQSIDLLWKWMGWFLYDNGLFHERVKLFFCLMTISFNHFLWEAKIFEAVFNCFSGYVGDTRLEKRSVSRYWQKRFRMFSQKEN